jgi:hypothetical protein
MQTSYPSAGTRVKPGRLFADTQDMTLTELVDLLKKVFLSPEVIGVTVVIVLYINVVNYIVRYRKKPPAPKKKRVATPKPAKPAPTEGEEEGDGDEEPSPSKRPAKK